MRNRKSYKVKCHLSIGLSGADRDDVLDLQAQTAYSLEELNEMPEKELSKLIEETCKEWALEYIEVGGELVG